MQIVKDHARVRVPATSANLGPGFDALGMALGIWDDVSATLTTGTSRVTILGEGAKELPKDSSHLIVQVMLATMARLGLPGAGIELVCRNTIPQGKGLGSSAAAVVAALMLVRGMISDPEALSPAQMLALATAYEGHPDNAAPCIYGGVTLSWQDGRAEAAAPAAAQVHTVQLALHSGVTTSLLVPKQVLPTSQARAVLPASVPHADAAFNAARAGLLVYALAHDPALLYAATEERLHQSYRAGVMPHSAAMLKALRDAGWPAVISGAGPAILLFAQADEALVQAANKQGFHVFTGQPVGGAELLA